MKKKKQQLSCRNDCVHNKLLITRVLELSNEFSSPDKFDEVTRAKIHHIFCGGEVFRVHSW